MSFAPIIIFAFNRLEALRATVTSLQRNSEAKESDLFIFVDGARRHKEELIKVQSVQKYVKSISGFKSVTYKFANENRGLGPSIIAGVTEVINQFGRAIVLEDDLVLSKNCLAFLNQSLDIYEQNKLVFSVCGYSNKVKVPHGYLADSYFCVRSSSWGWATWVDRWNSVDWNLKDWDKCKEYEKSFNQWGGSDCFSMLQAWKQGHNKSWAIRFCFAQFLQHKLTLFPIISKISNQGFDGQGTNCKRYNRFRFVFDDTENKQFVFPSRVEMNERLRKSALSYHSIFKRICSRLMYVIQR